jgi:uncharacterized damage-inducible protein DinB
MSIPFPETTALTKHPFPFILQSNTCSSLVRASVEVEKKKERDAMTPAYFQELYDFTYWNNYRVWECLMALSEEQVTQPVDESDWTLHLHCYHIIAVEEWWIRFLATGEVQFLDEEALSGRSALRGQWDHTENMVRAYVAGLTPTELQRSIRPPFWEDNQAPIKVYQALTQVALHSADHRAQMLTHIRRLGGPTVEQDFLGYLFVKQQPQG